MLWKVAFVAVLAVGVFGEYTIIKLPQEEKQAIIEFCRKANAEDKATEVETAMITFGECMTSLFNAETIKKEIEKAMLNGEFGEIFKKYCAKSSEMESCINAVVTGVTPCVPTELRENLLPFTDASNNLIDFVCYKNGDRMASFFAEEGVPQCVQEKFEDMMTCDENINTSGTVFESIFEPVDCSQDVHLSTCIMTTLKSCKSPTPANMAEEVFSIVNKGRLCSEV